ncbi:hypothetical protein AB4Z39_05145 [Mycobacterium adipatum]|uniref:hypothetical protein n=1 Tax=Mycobacterium adipatum TaxID=1682113 RepID=UPI0034E05C00
MPAVASPSLTLSAVRALDPGPLLEAAGNWSSAATTWEGAMDRAHGSLERANWSGPAADAAIEESGNHRRVVFADAEHIRSAVTTANVGANELVGAQQRILREVDDAINAGFDVGEDFSVTYTADSGMSQAAAAAKQSEAQTHAGEIQAAVANLTSVDESLARKLTQAAAEFSGGGASNGNGSAATPMSNWSGQGSVPLSPPTQPSPNPTGAEGGSSSSGRGRMDDAEESGKPGEEGGGKPAADDDPTRNDSSEKGDGESPRPVLDDDPATSATDPGLDPNSPEAVGVARLDDLPAATTQPAFGGGMPSPASSGGGMPKAPSMPSSPLSSLTNPASSLGTGAGSGASSAAGGGGQGVAPAAFDKPLQAASSSLLNNAPAPFAPPPAAASSSGGAAAPMTSPPPAAAMQQAAPLAGPAPAAAAPMSAPPPAVGGAGTPMGGGMLPPLMSSPAGGGMGGSPASMAAPPPAPAVPAAPGAGVSASAPPVMPVTAAERVRANIARVTGNTLGRVASDARALCAALHAATKNRPEVMWCVGGRLDGVLVVSNNIGLGWLPSNVNLPPPDGVLRVSRHVFAHGGEVAWSMRRDWVGHPVRAVRGYARATGDDVVVLACFEQAIDRQFDDVNGVQLDLLSESQVPAVGILAGVDRLQVVNPVLAEKITSEGVASLVAKLPSAMGNSVTDDAVPDPGAAAGLWLSVTTSAVVSVDAHLEAWTLFCANQLAASAHKLRRAADEVQARELYADYAYWQWNLEQVAQ